MKLDFISALVEKIEQCQNPSVLGLDPELSYLPPSLKAACLREFGDVEEAQKQALIRFNSNLLEACSGVIPIVKLQLAFYEKLGTAGLEAMAETARLAKEAGYLVIADAKRNDIGNSSAAYAAALLGETERVDGSKKCYLGADAITLNAYMGQDSLEPFFEYSKNEGKGAFILVRTSNPGAVDLQDQKLADGRQIFEAMADLIATWGDNYLSTSGYSLLGAVVGARWAEQARALRKRMPKQFFLIPGYGAQGSGPDDAVAGFAQDGGGAIVNASRSLMLAWKSQGRPIDEYADACRIEARQMRDALAAALARR